MATQSESSPVRIGEFALFAGGPLYQSLLRSGVVKPPVEHARRRILVISMLVWAPLLVLTVINGRLLAGVKIPFLYDYEVHIRLLASLPLLIAAELIIRRRINVLIEQFYDRQIVTNVLRPRFESLIESAMRLRNSLPIEIGMILLVFLAGGFVWRAFGALQSDTWYATVTTAGPVKTPAGYWYQFVSVPVSQFIALRWYFRLCIWARFLWHASKLDLNLVPTHPDGCCGLGFLGGIVMAMAPFLLAHSCLLSGNLANRILHDGAKLSDFYVEMGILAIFLSLLALGPLCVFTPSLMQAKRRGLLNYGQLASDYVVGFDRKWIRGERPSDEALVGTTDIQSLADLSNSFGIVRSIVPFPFGKNSLVGLAVIVALPLLPLSLTMFSLQEIAVRLLKILL